MNLPKQTTVSAYMNYGTRYVYRHTKNWKKLGIEVEKEVNSILQNCECGKVDSFRIVELHKLRKWEIMEDIGNHIDNESKIADWYEIKNINTFCKAYNIEKTELAEAYAKAICEQGCEIAYAINKDVILIIE